ncbi:hypothetical protein V9T40_000506 [Parthenolecanium corni]|uniref:Cytochrome P450 n=1 Tax=Parthenolecanium corni TaxID=536013 RepID=A0AAN9TMH7_9HEMI
MARNYHIDKSADMKRLELLKCFFKLYGTEFELFVGPISHFHIASADLVQTILSSNVAITKGQFYDYLKPWLGNGLLTSDGDKWVDRRKQLTPAFHFSILNNMTDTISRNSEILIEKLASEVDSDQFDIMPYLSSCTLDIICETAMGIRLNTQSGMSKEYIHSVHKITQLITDRVVNPFLQLKKIHMFTQNFREQQNHLKILHDTSLNVIKERIRERQKQNYIVPPSSAHSDSAQVEKKAFLDILLDLSETGDKPLSVADIREEVDTFMFEAHDTTSSALAWTIFLVGHHPKIQKRIREEVDSVFGSSGHFLNKNDLIELKYLECVFKEAIRLYPPVPVLFRTIKNDLELGDYFIPAGADVGLHVHELHRSPKHYHNPDKFDPSNFFPEKLANRHPYAYIPFSAGPRNCIGQKFALLEEKLILAYIFRHYELESLQPVADMTVALDTILRPEHGIQIKIKKRLK